MVRPVVNRTASVRFDEEAEVRTLRDDTHPDPQGLVLHKVVENPTEKEDHYRTRFFDARHITDALTPQRDFGEEEEEVVSTTALEQRIALMTRLRWLRRAHSHLETERQLKFFFSALDTHEKGVLTTRDLTEPLMSLNLAKSITDVRSLACKVEGGLTFQNFMRCVMEKDSIWGGLVNAMGAVSPHLSLKTSYLERRRTTMMSALLAKDERDLKILRGWAAQSDIFNFQAALSSASTTSLYRRRSSTHCSSYSNSDGIIQLVPKSNHLYVVENDHTRLVLSPREEDDDNVSIASSMDSCSSASSVGSAGRPFRGAFVARSRPNLIGLVSKLDSGNGGNDEQKSPFARRRSRACSFLYTSKQQSAPLSLVDSAQYMFSRFDLITSMLNMLIPHLSAQKKCIDARLLDQATRLVIDEDSATAEASNAAVKLASVKMLWPFLDNGHCGCLSLELLRQRLEVLTGGDATATTHPRDVTNHLSPRLGSPDSSSRVSWPILPLVAKPVLRKASTDGCLGDIASVVGQSSLFKANLGDGSRGRLRSVCLSHQRRKSSVSSIALSLIQAARRGSQAGQSRRGSNLVGNIGSSSGSTTQESKEDAKTVRTLMAGFTDRLEELMKKEEKWLGAIPTGIKVAPPPLVPSKKFKRKRPLRAASALTQACRRFWDQAYETTLC
eukprot:GEMP01011500.1.p1 GENE.GEMP01011500.1~~GEMP01011500.1.p1  ORF type:complete len:670 (+),score=169.44 GEMP01011500.1:101-2110(+)